MATPRPRWLQPRSVLLLAIGGVALLGAVEWFRDSETTGGDAGWESFADYFGAHIGIGHVVLAVAAIAVAWTRAPFGMLVGVVTAGVGVITGYYVGARHLAQVAGHGDPQSSSLLGLTSVALVVLGSSAAIVDLVSAVSGASDGTSARAAA